MTNMETLFKTALYLNLFLAQHLTTELCQGTMPATQGRQPFQITSLSSRVMLMARPTLQALPQLSCNQAGLLRNWSVCALLWTYCALRWTFPLKHRN